MFRSLRSERGVTLVELLLVVTILAIIAAIAVSLYQDIQKKAKLAADHGNVAAMNSGIAMYYGKSNGIFPSSEASVEALVIPVPTWQCGTAPTYTSSNGKLTLNVTVDDCP